MRTVERVEEVEFWPDYGQGPLWHKNGEPAEAEALGVEAELAERLASWNSRYDEANLPVDGPGSPAYIEEGSRLLREVRASVGVRYRVVVTEPWWGEDEE